MARVALVEDQGKPELADLIGRIRGRRRGRLINVYKLLLHSPELAETWFEHVNAVRWATKIEGRLREILIIRIAYLNGVSYVVNQHVPRLASAEGLGKADCDALADPNNVPVGFSPAELAAVAYADAMTRHVTVPDPVFAALRQHFSERQTVEITVLIGTYNMHTRVVQALSIDPEPSLEPA